MIVGFVELGRIVDELEANPSSYTRLVEDLLQLVVV